MQKKTVKGILFDEINDARSLYITLINLHLFHVTNKNIPQNSEGHVNTAVMIRWKEEMC